MSEQYCTFWVDDLYFGVEVEHVQEVLRGQSMTPVPKAPEAVLGLINLRGQIVTALDLRSRLGLPAVSGEQPQMNVILRSRGEVVSLVVDRIGDVIDTGGLSLQPAPSNLPGEVRAVLNGVLTLSEAILLVVDPHRAVELPADLAPTNGGTHDRP